ncbi:MAG: HNH endonuclease signature motif containing protein, partial [Mycobacterium sp.]
RGCTRPGCFAPADHCQANHVHDWATGGTTDADTIILGCGPDNLLAYNTGWTTTINPTTGRAQWHPPPLLDTSQDRTNHHFHPEELLNPPGADTDDP